MDLAIDNGSGAYAPSLSILLGNGDGTFQAPIEYPFGIYLEGIAAGDINGDGILDLVVADETNGHNGALGDLGIFLGNGDGTFRPPLIVAADVGPQYPVLADFNGDGKADIAVPNYNTSDISILLGKGDGTFQPAVNYSPGGPQPEEITVGDFNGDGKLDIATANADGFTAGVLLGKGDGTFQAAVTYPTSGGRPLGIASGDLNGDGILDLVVSADSALNALFGNGDGTFQPSVVYAGSSNIALGLALGDFNSDGRVEVASANIFNNNVGVFLGLPLPATTTSVVAATPNPSTYLQTVTITGTVFPQIATGTITFRDGPTVLNTSTIARGKVVFTIATLSAGTHSLTATYSGDANDLTSTSSPVTLTVNKAVTTTSASSSLNPSMFGQPVTFTARVLPALASGTVTFYDSAVSLGTSTLSGGTAALTISTLTVGSHSITATYTGSANFATSTSPVLTQTVNRDATTTSLASTPNPSNVGQNVKLTAMISPSTAIGTVIFYDGSAALASRTVSGGTAMLNTTALALGTHHLTAVYTGDATHAPSRSPVHDQVVQ